MPVNLQAIIDALTSRVGALVAWSICAVVGVALLVSGLKLHWTEAKLAETTHALAGAQAAILYQNEQYKELEADGKVAKQTSADALAKAQKDFKGADAQVKALKARAAHPVPSNLACEASKDILREFLKTLHVPGDDT